MRRGRDRKVSGALRLIIYYMIVHVHTHAYMHLLKSSANLYKDQPNANDGVVLAELALQYNGDPARRRF